MFFCCCGAHFILFWFCLWFGCFGLCFGFVFVLFCFSSGYSWFMLLLAYSCFLVVFTFFCCIPAWLKSAMPEAQIFWAAQSSSIAVTRKTTVYFIRSQMKWNRPPTSVQSHEPGLKFRAAFCSLAAVSPHPVTGTFTFHPPLGVQQPEMPWGLGATGAPPGQQGRAHPTNLSQGAGQAGLKWGPREAGQGH